MLGFAYHGFPWNGSNRTVRGGPKNAIENHNIKRTVTCSTESDDEVIDVPQGECSFDGFEGCWVSDIHQGRRAHVAKRSGHQPVQTRRCSSNDEIER